MTARFIHRAACSLVFLVLAAGCARRDEDEGWERAHQRYKKEAVELLDRMDSPDKDERSRAASELKFRLGAYATDEIARRAIRAESFEVRMHMKQLLCEMMHTGEITWGIERTLRKELCRPLTRTQKMAALNVCSDFAAHSETAVRFMVSMLRDPDLGLRRKAAFSILCTKYGDNAAEEIVPLLLELTDRKEVKSLAHVLAGCGRLPHPYIADLMEEAADGMDDAKLAAHVRRDAEEARSHWRVQQAWRPLPGWAYEPLPPWTGPPEAFSLTAPENGARGVPLNPLLDWEDAEGATHYGVMVSSESDLVDDVLELVNFVVDVRDLEESHYRIAPGVLRPRTRYYWRVYAQRALDGSTDFTFSTNGPYSFWTASDAMVIEPVLPDKVLKPLDTDTAEPEPPPRPFRLRTPKMGSEGVARVPGFEWQPSDWGVRYTVEVATDPEFKSIVASGEPRGKVRTSSGSKLEQQVSWWHLPYWQCLQPDTWYYWRVAAESEHGKTLCSGGYAKFRTAPAATRTERK